MNTMPINFEDGKTFYPLTVMLNLTDKINLKRNDTYVILSYQGIYHT